MKIVLPLLLALLGVPAALVAQQNDQTASVDIAIERQYSMPAEQVSELRAGEGVALALPAELNGYPGPRQVIDLAGPLELTNSQRQQVAMVRSQMTEAAVAKGAEILAAEARLTTLFREGVATGSSVDVLTAEIGRLQGELRSIHLSAHLLARSLLTREQIDAYEQHRGYAAR